MGASVVRFARDERGATAMEFGLIVCLLALAVVSAWAALGESLSGRFNNIATEVDR